MINIIPSFIIGYSNSDFTNPHEVILPEEPKDCTADHTHMGVKYWGLETKRHMTTRTETSEKKLHYNHDLHNWIRIGFKQRSVISELRISTKWFTGNQVKAISVILIDELEGRTGQEILSRQVLEPDQEHYFKCSPTPATECLVKLYYEGGIARINFLGEQAKEQLPIRHNILKEASISNVSNEHYGDPGMAIHGNREEMYMKGWESARTGFGEQAIFHLRRPAYIEEIVVDTYLHRLNAPLSCHIFGLGPNDNEPFENVLSHIPKWGIRFGNGTTIIPKDFGHYMLNQDYLKEKVPDATRFEVFLNNAQDSVWKAILPFESLLPDTYHRFANIEVAGPFSHLLYLHYPNGGIHGLKVFGR